ncbi:acetyl-CoA carboxylase biotin carboxyl carrier protein subunit [Streptococcus ratti]|uniref:Acetyl-CoA carboxylase biotin carboxyl carrier protein subunit n=1 Tax=Streptococcus ratti FA-1 = DSM 20564 TaxID=699248 RepID=A0ABP2QYC5_STRRT|nr:acetyl-CoA carboxylase biotin carboxyl carrier protein subunit [Streptococcus ratti]EJN93882.1 acetyl-CoA carboxylase biotin carboxyl carrier protein subunit [Streptococcus ratti FA-1 = DSM 20564]EMP71101.1 acetyl-CoA carboxylase biotin carboxyl carrier protein subunit [Streptococcus ratti FA-1 = DSM 20564]QEY07729.1 acetyl-CoA carboxylase biotin carboxyl carrier protein subunit [Streptococcus ratti]VEI60191.1 glutaconyl-CoA decarboxylase subunit gamma [Streptococcus mutans]
MLRKFKISVDGKEYLVEMEEIGGTPAAAPAAPAAPAPVQEAPAEVPAEPAPAPAAPAAASAPAGADAMTAPMPGTILKILVNVGDAVTENQPLMILEAMKMENEIVAGSAGTVSAIHVTQGQVVNAGDGLITIA